MKQRLRRYAASLLQVLLALPFAASGAVQELHLPQPDGRHAVGTTTTVVTDARRHRDLLVTIWYPAAVSKAAPALYMDAKTAAAVADHWTLQTDFVRHVHVHARRLAPVAMGGPFPVVLLEHGSEVVPAMYSVLAEGLASAGFVVVATNHPPDSLIAVFPNGRTAKFAPYWPADADRRTQGVAIGKFAEDVLLTDVRFVLDQLEGWNARDNFWRGHLDLQHIGIVGHSMGGTTAALATREERRLLAGVNLDGSTYPGMNGDVRPIEVRKPFLFLATEEHASDPETHAQEYVGSASNTYYVTLRGADHMSFTDARLLASCFSRETPPDPGAFERALALAERSRSLVVTFFAKYLQNQRALDLDMSVQVERK
jgi:dienelactone hydrolase